MARQNYGFSKPGLAPQNFNNVKMMCMFLLVITGVIVLGLFITIPALLLSGGNQDTNAASALDDDTAATQDTQVNGDVLEDNGNTERENVNTGEPTDSVADNTAADNTVQADMLYAFSFPSRPRSLSQLSPYLTVTNISPESIQVTLTFSAGDFSLSENIGINSDKTFELPTSVFLPASNGVSPKTVLLRSTGHISVYGFIAESKEDATMFSSFKLADPWDTSIQGAFLALSPSMLGKEYYISSHPKQQDFTMVFTIAAVEDNTAINIRFTSETGTPPGTRRFVLRLGESYQVLVKPEVALSIIEASKLVSVLVASNSEGNQVYVLTQPSPWQSFGNEFLVAPFEAGSYDYCIVASQNTAVTTCQVTSTSSICSSNVINDIECTQDLGADVYLKITADNPVAIYQYIKGYSTTSTELVALATYTVPPVSSYLSTATFSVVGDGNGAIKMYILSDTETNFEVNGETDPSSTFFRMQVRDLYVYRRPVTRSGTFTLTPTTPGAKFMVIVFGGHAASGAVPAAQQLDNEGSGDGGLVTTIAPVDVVNIRYESYMVYPIALTSSAVVGWTLDVYPFQEGLEDAAQIVVSKTGDGPVTFMITVTSVYEDDFRIDSDTNTFTLPASSQELIIPLSIIDDLRADEGTEEFTVALDRLDFGAVSRAETVIRITDNDVIETNPSIVGWEMDEYGFTEGATDTNVYITKTGDASAKVEIRVSPDDYAADFQIELTPITIPADETRYPVSLRITEDFLAEEIETFTLILDRYDTGSLSTAQTTITISDNPAGGANADNAGSNEGTAIAIALGVIDGVLFLTIGILVSLYAISRRASTASRIPFAADDNPSDNVTPLFTIADGSNTQAYNATGLLFR